MAWRASSVMEEKLRFVYEYERDEETMRELCIRFGISRETGYVWLRRYRDQGARGLLELNRAPRHHPNQTRVEIEEAVLGLREAHMRWGPRKLKRILERAHRGQCAELVMEGGHSHARNLSKFLYAQRLGEVGPEPCDGSGRSVA